MGKNITRDEVKAKIKAVEAELAELTASHIAFQEAWKKTKAQAHANFVKKLELDAQLKTLRGLL